MQEDEIRRNKLNTFCWKNTIIPVHSINNNEAP